MLIVLGNIVAVALVLFCSRPQGIPVLLVRTTDKHVIKAHAYTIRHSRQFADLTMFIIYGKSVVVAETPFIGVRYVETTSKTNGKQVWRVEDDTSQPWSYHREFKEEE